MWGIKYPVRARSDLKHIDVRKIIDEGEKGREEFCGWDFNPLNAFYRFYIGTFVVEENTSISSFYKLSAAL